MITSQSPSISRPVGRPSSPDSLVPVSVRLSHDQIKFLSLWTDNDCISLQLRDCLERAMKFWPAGPNKFR